MPRRQLTPRRVLAAAFLLCAASAAAFAGITPVLPGQRAYGSLESGESLPLAIEAPEGASLTVDVLVWKGDTLLPEVTLEGPDGEPVEISGFLRVTKAGKRVRIAGLPLAASGAYVLRVAAVEGTSGGFDVRTSAKRKTALSVRGTLAGEGAPQPVEFRALRTDRATLTVLPRSAVVKDLVAPDAEVLLVGTAGRAGPIAIDRTGRWTFHVEGRPGAFRSALKLVPAKVSKVPVEIVDLIGAGSVSGRLVVEGSAPAPGKGGPAKSGSRRRVADVVRPGEMIVSLPGRPASGEVVAAAEAAVPGVRFELVRSITDEGPHLLRAIGTMTGRTRARDEARTRSLVRGAAASRRLAWAETNGVRAAAREPNDALWQEQADFRTMRIPDAWEVTTGVPAAVVAVLDTGIAAGHPDFEGRLLPGRDFVDDPANAVDGNGWDADPEDAARDYHGTHVAGTIGAATDNRVGVAGVMWNCRIVPIRVLGAQGGADFDIASGIRWAAGLSVNGAPANPNPAKILNMSLGGPGQSTAIGQAVQAAISSGAVVVAAAGNSASSNRFYPAAFPGVISVSSAAPNLSLASYSNFGDWITIAATGGDLNTGQRGILSTFVDERTLRPTYTELQGTSMACPHVAGVVGLMRSVAPNLTPAQVKNLLETTAVDLGAPGFDTSFGWGLVDAAAAVRAAQGTSVPAPVLSVAPASLDLGPGADEATITVRNVGTGQITGITATASADGGGTWLTATASGTAAPATVRVAVDRSTLADGLHTGTVTIATSAGTAAVPVRLTKAPPVDVGTLTVAAVDAGGTVRGTATTTLAAGYEYTIPDLPAGDYRIVAFADRDGDQEIRRVDEWFGEWPVAGTPEPVRVAVGAPDVTGVDFAVGRVDALYQFDGAGGGPIAGAVAVRVTDERTSLPVAGARVWIGNGAGAGTTDSRGRSVMTGPFTGAQTVTVAAAGYGTLTQIGSNAQYQSFSIAPLADAPTFRATVTVDGLGLLDDVVIVQVGDVFGYEFHDGVSGSVTVSVDVPVEPGEIPVWILVYDLDGDPSKVALDTIGGASAGATVPVDVVAFSPDSSFWTQPGVTVQLPSANFQTGTAELYADTGLFWDNGRTLLIGADFLDPGVASRIAWISFGNLDPLLSAEIRVYATDGLGRSSAHVATGTVDALSVPSTFRLKSPPGLTAPLSGAQVDPDFATFTFTPPAGTDASVLTIRDAADGTTVWTIFVPAGTSSVPLPQVPTGGLGAGRSYVWSVGSFFVPGLDFDDYLDDAFLTGITDLTFSDLRPFSVP